MLIDVFLPVVCTGLAFIVGFACGVYSEKINPANIVKKKEMMYYTNDNGDIAKVLGVDDRTNMATVVINDKTVEMDWDRFIEEFKRIKK